MCISLPLKTLVCNSKSVSFNSSSLSLYPWNFSITTSQISHLYQILLGGFQPTWKSLQFSEASPPSGHSSHSSQLLDIVLKGASPWKSFYLAPLRLPGFNWHKMWTQISSWISLKQTYPLHFTNLRIKSNRALHVNSIIMFRNRNQFIASSSLKTARPDHFNCNYCCFPTAPSQLTFLWSDINTTCLSNI